MAASRLPEDLRALLNKIGKAVETGAVNVGDVERATVALGALSASSVAELELWIAQEAGLTHWPGTGGLTAWWRGKNQHHPHLNTLRKYPILAQLFLTHRNGYVREAALAVLPQQIRGRFWIAVLCWRLNDWNEQVRTAAHDSASGRLPLCDASELAQAALVLLDRFGAWTRWPQPNAALAYDVFSRSDVVDHLAFQLKQPDQANKVSVFRAALRHAWLDPHLYNLFRDARLPDIRAIALRALLTGEFKWINGYQQQWLDKSFGHMRYVPTFATRGVSHPVERLTLLREGAEDKSMVVRRVVAKVLFDAPEASADIDPLIEKMSQDPSRTIQWYAEFARNHRSGKPSST